MGAHIVVLTPYLAQLMELRDVLDGTISDQDAADLAVVIREGGGGGGGGGYRCETQVKSGPINDGYIRESPAFGTDPKPKVRISTGEWSKCRRLYRRLS